MPDGKNLYNQPKPKRHRRKILRRILHLEERIDCIEQRLDELEFLPIDVAGEIISVADWRESDSLRH
ncbi:hypothetical protein DSM106972_023930 [Dulcicalothrix desertica PCC 7102]|uniref:Uncharacterized protein n=1 Tax=Dulcicalothrix desertica PCC 7102 TaxID=232991 RepID=A0A3S1AQU5_9CYAN|nr:hypothetical protein [Dulcicalothrix desertica]RUT07132.1 hypothetical protein DSM106972_023930 [Dulcicalothrix desertica PCC 7102]TWH61871.1 hypothetical protein CAL7102_00549 [Dulcicalothrix desertica PCC 7102]